MELGCALWCPDAGQKEKGKKNPHGRCPPNIRKHFFIMRVTECWYRLPREKFVKSPSLEIFKGCLDMVLEN